MKRVFSLFIFSLNLFVLSCSQIKYTSSNNIQTYISVKDGHHLNASHSGRRVFYLWGMVPAVHTVNVDEELADDGVVSVARVEVREYQELLDVFWTYVTLGVYTPISYEISGYGVKE